MDLELDINSASQNLHHKDSRREPVETRDSYSPIFLTPQFLSDPEPMDNFVVPTGVWSDGAPDQM
jgi:hypothetical protein